MPTKYLKLIWEAFAIVYGMKFLVAVLIFQSWNLNSDFGEFELKIQVYFCFQSSWIDSTKHLKIEPSYLQIQICQATLTLLAIWPFVERWSHFVALKYLFLLHARLSLSLQILCCSLWLWSQLNFLWYYLQ